MLYLGQIAGKLLATQQTIESRPNRLKATSQTLTEKRRAQKAAFSQKAWYQMGRTIMSAYTHLTLKLDVRWHAPLPEGPKILAANHPTTVDPLYLLPLLSEPVSFVITAASFDIPLVGAYLRAAGHVPAVRGSGGATLAAIAQQVESGRSVAIFPEGALSPLDGGFHPPHSGVARVALRTGAPVISIGIGLQRERIRVKEAEVAGERAVGHFYLSGPYAITVGRPQSFQGDPLDREQVRATADQIMHQIRTLARESETRILQGQAAEAGTQPTSAWQTVVN